jgi:hypothetical protein
MLAVRRLAARQMSRSEITRHRYYILTMTLDPTDDETAALLQLLRRAIDEDRYPLSSTSSGYLSAFSARRDHEIDDIEQADARYCCNDSPVFLHNAHVTKSADGPVRDKAKGHKADDTGDDERFERS